MEWIMKKNNILKKINKKGFSLIELMVVVVVLSLIILGLVVFFTGGARSWISGQNQLSAQRNARQAMDRMVREIREGSDIASVSNSTSITINFDYLDSKKNPVTFNLPVSSTTIYRNGTPLISNVKKLEFTYFTESKVHIELEVDVDDDGKPDITLNTDVNLRNYGL